MSEVMRWRLKGFLPGVEGMCSAVMRPEVVLSSDYDAAQSELAALREELATANEKIDQAWNRSHAIDHKGFIPGALDAWKRPVPQHLPYDFSGNPGASATQYCNGWNDCGGYWSGHAADLQQRLADAEQRNALPADWADQLFSEMERRFELSKQYHQDHLVNDDTQIGVEFAIEWITAALKPTESGASE